MCTCSSMLSLKFFVYSKYYSAHSENRDTPSGRLQEVKNNGKSLTVWPKKWWRSFRGGVRLHEVPTVRLSLGKCWCFGLAVVYGSWSLTSGDSTWRFDDI